MAESACLVRSFSNPAEISHEAKERCSKRWKLSRTSYSLISVGSVVLEPGFENYGQESGRLMVDCEPQDEPIRALTESVSFGRFMSESLAWEKWSTFSHNRYLEEVEKFSKPGSVAQKKAFFEAHYKRRAAMRAAALLEQANTVTNDTSQMGTINATPVDPSLNSDSAVSSTSLAVNQQEKYVSDAEVANTADVDAGNLNVERDNMEVTYAEKEPAVMEKDVNMENNNQVENSKALEVIVNHSIIIATPDTKHPHKECTDQKNSTSSNKKRRTNSLSKSSTPSKASRLPLHPSKRVTSAQARSDAGVAEATGNSYVKKKTGPNSIHMSINFASGTNKTSKMTPRMPKDGSIPLQTPTRASKKAADQENLAPSSEKRLSNSTSKLSNYSGGSKQATSRVGNNYALVNKKSAGDSNEQKRIVQKSLHMSINFSPRAGQTNKTLPKISRESSTPIQTPIRASVNVGSDNSSKVIQSQDKRTRAVLNKLVSRGVTRDGRWPPLSNCSKSSTASGTSTRSPVSSCPFNFRSEERAAKRKEFFKKLEDKRNSNEAEKSQTQLRLKEKAKNDLNKLRQSTDFKARPNEDLYHGSQSSQNHIKKTTSTWPQSPRKPSPSTVQDANSRPPRRPSIITENSKHVSMKNNRITCSVTSLPKNRHENSSPNIQLSVGKGNISHKRELSCWRA